MNEQQMRESFERWISAPPFAHMCDRHPSDTGASPWPGMYKRYETEIAWEAWQAALRASGALPAVKESLTTDAARELADALRGLLDRYVQVIGNEGIECYKSRAALARYEEQK